MTTTGVGIAKPPEDHQRTARQRPIGDARRTQNFNRRAAFYFVELNGIEPSAS